MYQLLSNGTSVTIMSAKKALEAGVKADRVINLDDTWRDSHGKACHAMIGEAETLDDLSPVVGGGPIDLDLGWHEYGQIHIEEESGKKRAKVPFEEFLAVLSPNQ